jgi:hypothetical protein
MMAVSAATHTGALFGHEPSGWSLAFALDVMLLVWAGRRLVRGGRGWPAATVLTGSILGVVASAAAGEVPDQVVLAVKLAEVLGLLALLSPADAGRMRRAAGTIATGMVAALVTAVTWGVALEGSHGVPGVGTAMPAVTLRPPTEVEREAAEALHRRTAATLARYDDPMAAAADGFQVEGITGTDFHADNPANLHDGGILDPTRPETLVYGVDAGGDPVLMGAMFQMDGVGEPGPAVGGPLTVWHAHEQVCVGLLPPGIAGLTSPFGACPVGSIAVPLTNEMIHVWTVEGAPETFGDLPEDWRLAYLGFGDEPAASSAADHTHHP